MPLTVEQLRDLIEERPGPCVSLYVPPSTLGERTPQAPLRLANLLRQAEDLLVAWGLRPVAARELLAPVAELRDRPVIWARRQEALAIFAAPGLARVHRLMLFCEESLVVSPRFHIRPLLPPAGLRPTFLILALSHNQIRLLRVEGEEAVELPLPPGVPVSLEEAMRFEEGERQLQFRTGSPSGPAERPAMFHGHGDRGDRVKDQLLRFFQALDRGLHPLLRQEGLPLLLAGAGYELPIYRQANTYAHLEEEELRLSPDRRSAQELRQEALRQMEERQRAGVLEARRRLQALLGTGLATLGAADTLRAAREGRVAQLLVARCGSLWGRWDAASGEMQLHQTWRPKSEDLLDLATTWVLRSQGQVLTLEGEALPQGAPLGAVLRY